MAATAAASQAAAPALFNFLIRAISSSSLTWRWAAPRVATGVLGWTWTCGVGVGVGAGAGVSLGFCNALLKINKII